MTTFTKPSPKYRTSSVKSPTVSRIFCVCRIHSPPKACIASLLLRFKTSPLSSAFLPPCAIAHHHFDAGRISGPSGILQFLQAPVTISSVPRLRQTEEDCASMMQSSARLIGQPLAITLIFLTYVLLQDRKAFEMHNIIRAKILIS